MNNLRSVIKMDGGWKFSRVNDSLPADTEYSYDRTKSGSRRLEALRDYDDSSWQPVDLPHDWAVGSEFGEQYLISHGYRERGAGLYRKVFKLDASFVGRQLLLCFCGVSNKCTVYFNGSIAARNFSGYNEFTVDITDRAYVDGRDNVLMLHVDADDIEGWWYEGAGIYRHVWLYAKGQAHIAHNGVFAKPRKSSGAQWNVDVEITIEDTRLCGQAPTVFTIVTEVFDGSLPVATAHRHAQRCDSGAAKIICLSLAVDKPVLWDINNPKLYELRIRLMRNGQEIDREQTSFGFRTIGIAADTGFYLNGRRVFIKGACIHQDHAGVGVALPDSIHEYRIRRLMDMGCNAIRCAHNPPAREFLDACDRLGMLVMDENRHFESTPETQAQVETMVRRDRNHPCIAFYSLFNEEPLAATAEGRNVFRRLKQVVLRLDNTRLIIGAMNVNTMLAQAGAAIEMDITGFNYYLDNYDVFQSMHASQPVIGSENCATCSTRGCYASDPSHGLLNSYDEESGGCFETMQRTWKAISARSYVGGIFIWSGFDYRGEPVMHWPSVSSQFGLMDTCGFPKDAFYFAKACFAEEPMLHLMPHWNWNASDRVKVKTVTNCEEAEVFLNGISLGRKRSSPAEQCSWDVQFEPGTLSATGYNGGVAMVSDAVHTAGKPNRIQVLPYRDTLDDSGVDAVPVAVCLTDDRGTVVPCADNHIVFSLSGDGRLLGTGNGNPNSHENDTLPERDLFNGWCQAIVQASKDAKELTLTVTSDGFEPTEVHFCLKRVDTASTFIGG
jgi:beta-galactosidase